MKTPDSAPGLRDFIREAGYYDEGFLQPSMLTTFDAIKLGDYAKSLAETQGKEAGIGELNGVEPFYGMIYEESRRLFGESNITVADVNGDNLHVFIGEAGRPHSGVSNTIESERYFATQAKYFNHSDIGNYESVEKAPHNVVWAVGEESLFTWDRIADMEDEDKKKLFDSLSEAVAIDAEFISEITDNDTVQVTIALGFDSGFSAQTKETAHIHVLGKRENEPDVYKKKITDIVEKRKFLAQLAYTQNILGSTERVSDIVEDVVRGIGVFDGVDTKINLPQENIYAPVVFKVDTLEGTQLRDVLELATNLYTQTSNAWELLKESGQKNLTRHPTVPSFAIGCDYQDGRITELRVIPTLYGYVVPENGAQLQISQ